MNKCRFCHQAPVFDDDGYVDYYSEIALSEGGWTVLYIAVDEHSRICMRACGDDYTDNYYPKYCPECGRKLNYEDFNDQCKLERN